MLADSTSPAGFLLCGFHHFGCLVYRAPSVCCGCVCVCVCVKDPFFIRITYPIPTSRSPRGDRANFRQIFPLSKLLAMGNIPYTLPQNPLTTLPGR